MANKKTSSHTSDKIYDLHTFGILVDDREIYVGPNLNESADDAYIDHVVANQFIRNLHFLNSISNENIIVYLITCGGDFNYGMAIYDAIFNSCHDECLSNIAVISYAHARSMSSVIPQAATKRYLTKNADYLVHYGTFTSGLENANYTSAIAESDWAKVQTESMIQVYVDRIYKSQFFRKNKMKKEDVKNWLIEQIKNKQEFYMTAEEAVYKGFADGIIGKNNLKISEIKRQF